MVGREEEGGGTTSVEKSSYRLSPRGKKKKVEERGAQNIEGTGREEKKKVMNLNDQHY